MKRFNVTFERVINHESRTNIPTLKVRIINEDGGVNIVCGYLSPFRSYKFQVSGTITGQCDFGSSHIMSLKDICMTLDESIVFNLFEGQIALALEEFFKSNYVNNALENMDEYIVIRPNYMPLMFSNNENDKAYINFIHDSISWIKLNGRSF